MVLMSMELVAETRGELLSDPNVDEIRFIAACVQVDGPDPPPPRRLIFLRRCLAPKNLSPLRAVAEIVELGDSEDQLIDRFLEALQKEDPDTIVGFEIQRSSWGYLLERGRATGRELPARISRVPGWERGSEWSSEEGWWSMANISIAGRIVLNLWRILRHEASLRSYTLENVVYHLLHIRVPFFSDGHLNRLLSASHTCGTALEYVLRHCGLELELLRSCDILNRTTEMAKLYGIQFFDVLSRGSQFRVESMLLRLTREEGFAAPSPSPRLRSRMAAPECIALTLEPQSALYTEPVLVLDFQSLYPSIVIAYNYCYSTCLGKLDDLSRDPGDFALGCLRHGVSGAELAGLGRDDVHFSPAGVGFVRRHVRRGVLPSMLEEILATRLMVKAALKRSSDSALRRVLDARQLALKLIANVTYGYTSANFSGRMPCVEVADSIVHKGREALETAIRLVTADVAWDAQVVYGDTDSLFVHLPGRTKAEAFRIGAEIAAKVTAINPKPMKLKFEKVFYPCVLQTKKRYVGYSYETPGQTEPLFDAKGIETVRRDSISLVNKVLEKSLRILFDDMGAVGGVKEYLVRTFGRVRMNRVSLPEFVFAKEFRGAGNYKPAAVVPAMKIAKTRGDSDGRSVPLISERVNYVVAAGPPNATLFSCVREPSAFLANPSLRVNYHYYLKGVLLPPLHRALSLAGVDVSSWLSEAYARFPETVEVGQKDGPRTTLTQLFRRVECLLCRALCPAAASGLCRDCETESGPSRVTLLGRLGKAEGRLEAVRRLCGSCSRLTDPRLLNCESLDCPILFKRTRLAREQRTLDCETKRALAYLN